jgi:hypothetical protein
MEEVMAVAMSGLFCMIAMNFGVYLDRREMILDPVRRMVVMSVAMNPAIVW